MYQRSEREDVIPSKTLRFCLAVRQGDGIVVEHLPLSSEEISAQDKEVEEYIKEGNTPPKDSPFPRSSSPNNSSSASNSSSTSAHVPKFIWSDPKNIFIPFVLLLVAAIYGKEDTPAEKTEKEKEKEEKMKKDQNLRKRKPKPAVALDPSKNPQRS